MKHLFILILGLGIYSSNVYAQFEVDSLGKVKIGDKNMYSQLSVYAEGNGQTGSNNSLMSIVRNVGIHSLSKSTDTSCPAIGVLGEGQGGECNIGVLGSASMSLKGWNSVGIYGTSTGIYPNALKYPGVYAGYFEGPVLATGKIYGSIYSLTSAPQSSMSKSSLLSDVNTDGGNTVIAKGATFVVKQSSIIR